MKRYKVPFIARVIRKWPGKKYFGEYRFLPLFFVLGGALEFFMINWTVGQTNFYRTYKNRQIEELVTRKLHQEKSS